MHSSSGSADHDYEIPSEVRIPGKHALALFALGFPAFVLGSALEFIIYPYYEVALRDVPMRINGWYIAAIGAVLAYIGAKELIFRPVYLSLDFNALHSPRQRLTIPWDLIRGVRGLILDGGGGGYIAVRVADLDRAFGAESSRRLHHGIIECFGDDEVPVLLPFQESEVGHIVTAIERHLASMRP
ncbi:hypothetical protein TA3x_000625 [Tundrisphaera sp. TA3]|uniref:hypothetical protein n=1 Tax=Tundrisphaera sp. TA3 TaxID=3435775 RepID=UPI003EBAF777